MRNISIYATLAASVAIVLPVADAQAAKKPRVATNQQLPLYSRGDGTGHGRCVRGGMAMRSSAGRNFTQGEAESWCNSHGH